jgi:hypothetical protein
VVSRTSERREKKYDGAMRGAAAATLATVLGLVGCQEEEVTAIRLIVSPDDAAVVRQADQLQVYVGYGMAVVPRDVRVHADDGRMVTFEVGAFIEPIEVYLTPEGETEPFWVGVRAGFVKPGGAIEIVGEGGHATPLAFEEGVLLEARIDVAPARDPNDNGRLPGVFDRCPGWTDANATRHHIVAEMDGIDCDEDGYPYTQGSDDCDDFDPSFNPMAMDQYCDHIDHTCGRNTYVGSDERCVGPSDPIGACILGNTVCVDDNSPPADCEGPGLPLPDQTCMLCGSLAGTALDECIKDSATRTATCSLSQDGASFCQTEPFVLNMQPSWWMSAGGTSMGRTAQWLRLGPAGALRYGWVAGATTAQPLLVTAPSTNETPPSPAFYLDNDGDVTVLGDSFADTAFTVMYGGLGGVELIRVDVSVNLVSDCAAVAPTCVSWPIGPM